MRPPPLRAARVRAVARSAALTLCLLASAASAWAWPRSYKWDSHVNYSRPRWGRRAECSASVADGRILFGWEWSPRGQAMSYVKPGWEWGSTPPLVPYPWGYGLEFSRSRRGSLWVKVLGFEYMGNRGSREVIIPMWFTTTAPLAAVGARFLRRRRVRVRRDRRLRAGLCQRCGYDLRGGGGGCCPECGATVAAS